MGSGQFSISAGFHESSGRKLFNLALEPEVDSPRGAILFLHPFAEEMHMARRNVAAQARALAAAGYRVLLPDLTGCGDAQGQFSDATWEVWREDANNAMALLGAGGDAPMILWGLRLGGLLAASLAAERRDVARLLLWQPVLNGEQQVDQFLRLRTAASVIDEGAVFDRNTLWNELRAGRPLEIAGYELSPALAREVARVRLAELTPHCPVHWLEVGAQMARPSRGVVESWRERGLEVSANAVDGNPFWRNHDAPLNTRLQRATLEALS